ncbi:amino acid adenylation domain-containing protein [Mucilaginibacter sp. CSA2-8R]|uniref:amino acid adenylation domain-containing protein n=1 Tax=Mucilaginibacter sp. CSA2-8R TaxID=3141542 RepID=UPI00315D2AD9
MSFQDTPLNESLLVSNIVQLVEEQARLTPDAIALKHHDSFVSYQNLIEKTNALAANLIQHNAQELVIGLSTTRNIQSIIALLAILKAGKAYLPLNPSQPTLRNTDIINEAAILSVIASGSDCDVFRALGLKVIDGGAQRQAPTALKYPTPSLAYVMYTSGSTGRPKGVAVAHQAAINLQLWMQSNLQIIVGAKTLQYTPLTFDVSFQEIFSTLTTGGTLVLVDDDIRLDPRQLLAFLNQEAINRLFLPFVALHYLTDAAGKVNLFPESLQVVVTAGEQLKVTPQLKRFFKALPNCILRNQYGPTEAHIIVTDLILSGTPDHWPDLPNIGKSIKNVTMAVLDDHQNFLPDGQSGELYIGGVCLAEGYWKQEALTQEKFITLQHPQMGAMRMYRTGDLGLYMPDGNIQFLGRVDHQVKIRGNRVELGEIESVLNGLPEVEQAVVVVKNNIANQPYLAAYVVAGQQGFNMSGLREALTQRLPDYMIPATFTKLADMPYNAAGKVDRNALPDPLHTRPDLNVDYQQPETVTEGNLAKIWCDLLQLDKVGTNDNFFDLGGNSLLALKLVVEMQDRFHYQTPVTKIFQLLTIKKIAASIDGSYTQTIPAVAKAKKQVGGDIAVIGIAGRFPGADDTDQLWDLLKEGREGIRFFAENELDANVPQQKRKSPDYVKARGVINHADQFDAEFFNINPKLAELMDPQQRVFLEIAWEVLESTGHLPGIYHGKTGVFAGTGNNSYYRRNVLSNPHLVSNVGSFQVMAANEKDYISTRTAYELNLNGPAVTVLAACSTSLVAVAQAVESLRAGKCDVAIAGGVAITSPINSGYLYKDGAMLSNDGHCRPFDAHAGGTTFSDGAGVVLLKPKEAAERDGDYIYGIIKGIGLNNDGGSKGNFAAPSAEGQAGAIAAAITDAGVDPGDISYVEAHGTATYIGDPMEIEGLKIAFGKSEATGYCGLGSIKSNVGHLTAAAGVAGLIKVVLAFKHQKLPPTINYHQLNPNILLDNSPFYINNTLSDWYSTKKRTAGVSSFGVGGTNAHVIVEEATQPNASSVSKRPLQLITWSAKNEVSLGAYAEHLSIWAGENVNESLADVAYTLQTKRKHFNQRSFAVLGDTSALSNQLIEEYSRNKQGVDIKNKQLAFVFPGQDAKYLHMCRELYEYEPVFKNAVDDCAKLFLTALGEDIRNIIYPAGGDDRLNQTQFAQPALFTMSYAMAQLWLSWGIMPTVVIGHSIGELAAAYFAGVLSLTDAVTLVSARGRLIAQMQSGAMLAVRAHVDQLKPLLVDGVSLAAVNGPKNCVLSGSNGDVQAFAARLDALSIPAVIMQAQHAFHSQALAEAAQKFEEVVTQVTLNEPVLPLISTATGKRLTAKEAKDPAYWSSQIVKPVLFADAIDTLMAEGIQVVIETGPNQVCSSLIAQQVNNVDVLILPSSLQPQRQASAYMPLFNSLGKLWQHGIEPDWIAFYKHENRRKIILPTYAFNRQNCWVNPPIDSNAEQKIDQQLTGVSVNETKLNKVIPLQQPAVAVNDAVTADVKQLLQNGAGVSISDSQCDTNFIDLGIDSLMMTQIRLTFQKHFGINITFRQFNAELYTLNLLTDYLVKNLPADRLQQYQPQVNQSISPIIQGDDALSQISRQLQVLTEQVAALQKGEAYLAPVLNNTSKQETPASHKLLSLDEQAEIKKPFGATARIERTKTELNKVQAAFLHNFTKAYNQKTAGSKAYTQQHRKHMADPRVVSGFKPQTKELTYSIVVEKSEGSRLWDIDGNEYIDALNGFGSNMLGYQPEIIKNAITAQIQLGYEIGPQHKLAGEVSELLCEFTGFDRSALCNTGSEAVLGAMRIARTVTNRSIIVAFTGSYHGIIDEVIVRGAKNLRSYPAAPGIMPEAVQNMLILDYGTEQSLDIIRSRGHEIAAVLVEPVQSRRPEFQPVEFLKQLRNITSQAGTILVFDEVITGFRMHSGGAQALFGIKADLATYGKVIGGGLSIGAIAGHAPLMDALDGGYWQYGDDSMPEAGVTYFAGTFVRHPLALAAAKASLLYFKAKGPSLQKGLTNSTTYLANALNAVCKQYKLPLTVAYFGSLWKIKFIEDVPYSELLFHLMRFNGIHIYDGFPCFLTEAHSRKDIDRIISVFKECVQVLINAQVFKTLFHSELMETAEHPPVEGAVLGRDLEGRPGWYTSNKEQPGKYLQVII